MCPLEDRYGGRVIFPATLCKDAVGRSHPAEDVGIHTDSELDCLPRLSLVRSVAWIRAPSAVACVDAYGDLDGWRIDTV